MGRAAIRLSFKTAEMNDVLKSLTVLDLGDPCGTISSISYEAASMGGTHNSLGMKTATSDEGQFDVNIQSCHSFVDLLRQLKGISVQCTLKKGGMYQRFLYFLSFWLSFLFCFLV